MLKRILPLVTLSWAMIANAQVTETFNDGDFTANPPWTGSLANWIINTSGQLQSANNVANSGFYLSTAHAMVSGTQWELYTRLQFNTSSANYVDVYLVASAADVMLTSTTGYFVRIGNTADEIALYRKDANGTVSKIIDGVDGITNFNDNTLKIKVTCDAAHRFTLYRDVTGTGNNYVSEGSVIDLTYTSSAFFSILVRQSTSSFFQRHYFDDIYIRPFTPDITPPVIQSVHVISNSVIDVVFSEAVDLATSQTLTNYSVNNGIGNPVSVQRDGTNPAIVRLSFSTYFPIGINLTLTINGVEDLSGNSLSNGTAVFSFYTAQRNDIVIHEIMADPTPTVSLPYAEFVELKNTSGRTLNLQGCRLSTHSAISSAFPSYDLPADSFLIITSTSNAAAFIPYGRVLGVGSFPALDNNGTVLSLTSKEGKVIHAVEYTDVWYENTLKKEGGWSLEMVDSKSPCLGSGNWRTSIAVAGGTPGKKNSVAGNIADETPPILKRSFSLNRDTLILIFNEPLDSASAASLINYKISPHVSILGIRVLPPLFTNVELKLGSPLELDQIYTVTVSNVADCKGNDVGSRNTVKAGVAKEVSISDVVINEILFNPKLGGEDYVEIYNRSKIIVDASKLYLANRNASGDIGSLKKLAETPLYIFPGDYMVITESQAALEKGYFVKNRDAVQMIASLPSYPDDAGKVVLVDYSGAVIDEIAYTHQWHFALMADKEGVALERIDPNGTSQDKNNWHSAATTAGYGTPGYQNSQYRQLNTADVLFRMEPKVFSPDQDGVDDLALFQYQLESPGYVAALNIYDANGRLVRQLVRNALLGIKGTWSWDGLDDKGQKLPMGTYIVAAEFFNLEGKKQRFKQAVVLARK